jgi:RPA family protein
MSANIPSRKVARRVFAREFNDASYTFRESDDERAPIYLLLPTGAEANRVFLVGTLTEKEDLGSDSEYWRGRVVGPTGTFFAYAGQYQPDAAATLREIEPPAYVAIVGKPRTYQPDDADEDDVLVSVQPESINVVDADVRDRWVVETAERTLDRVAAYDDEANEYAAMARERYDLPTSTYRDQAVQALESLDGNGDTAPAAGAEAEAGPEL